MTVKIMPVRAIVGTGEGSKDLDPAEARNAIQSLDFPNGEWHWNSGDRVAQILGVKEMHLVVCEADDPRMIGFVVANRKLLKQWRNGHFEDVVEYSILSVPVLFRDDPLLIDIIFHQKMYSVGDFRYWFGYRRHLEDAIAARPDSQVIIKTIARHGGHRKLELSIYEHLQETLKDLPVFRDAITQALDEFVVQAAR